MADSAVSAITPIHRLQPTAYRGGLAAAFGCQGRTEEIKGMPLPQLNDAGELPAGVHQATMDEVLAQFGSGSAQRQAVTARLRRIYDLARATRKLERLIL